MATKHFLYSAESAFGTWVTPAKAIEVNSVDIGSEREVIDLRQTGAMRGIKQRVLGAKGVGGSISTPWHVDGISTILKQFLRDTATTTNDGYIHGFLIDEENPLLGLSIQKVYREGATALNILSAIVNTWTITAASKEIVQLEFAMLAKDEALVGDNWDYDGSATPTYVSNPGTLYPALNRPFIFSDGQISLGGTPSLNATTKIISLSGATAYAKVLTATITLDNGLDAEGYGITQDPTRQEIWPGNREITVTFDISWTDYSETFYDAARAGTPLAFEFAMVGPELNGTTAKANVVIPSLFFDINKLPPISGEQGRHIITVSGKAQEDTVTGKDFNVWMENDEATI
jgi:hypothetical protein